MAGLWTERNRAREVQQRGQGYLGHQLPSPGKTLISTKHDTSLPIVPYTEEKKGKKIIPRETERSESHLPAELVSTSGNVTAFGTI